MSAELVELRRMARAERRRAWKHARLVPARAGDVASGFARAHPAWAMGGAAALTLTLVARHRRRNGIDRGSRSWPMALAALGSRLLPEILRAVGLTRREDVELERGPADEATSAERDAA